MTIVDRIRSLFRPRNQDRSNMSMTEFAQWLRENASLSLNERTAMSIPAIYACVNKISSAIAPMRLRFYRAPGDEYEPDLSWLFNVEPHPAWSASVAWTFALESILLRGDAFWRITRAGTRPVAIEPLHPDYVQVTRTSQGRLAYRVMRQPWQVNGSGGDVTLDQADVLHVPGAGFDGLRGMSQIRHVLARPGALSIAADQYAISFFRDRARSDIALKTPANMQPDEIAEMKQQWMQHIAGLDNARFPIILSGGLEIERITLDAVDAQLIEQRIFQVEEIARIFGVPPWMIGHKVQGASPGSSLAEEGLAFLKFTIRPYLDRIEREIKRKLMPTGSKYCRFDTSDLERISMESRFNSYRVALGRAGEQQWMTVDEIRATENLPPLPRQQVTQNGQNDAVA